MDREIAQLLHRAGALSGRQLAQALQRNDGSSERFAQTLDGLGFMRPLEVLAALQQAGVSGARCAECASPFTMDLAALSGQFPVCACGGAVGLVLRSAEGALNATQEVAPPTETARRCGRYELQEELGAGSFGSVWRAWDPLLSREVALKQLLRFDPNTRSRFEREVQVTSRLDHSNIVRLLDHGDERGRPFLVMELIEGPTLETLARSGLRPERAAQLVEQIARGIQHAHEQGVLHRDLKPENVLVRGDQPKVVDFGLARLGERRSELTRSGTTLGTPHYMAPEQAGAEGIEIGPHTDVYALGGVLYYTLTGRPPLDAKTEQEMWMSIFRRRPDPPSKHAAAVPAALDDIVLRCLEKEPDNRYASAAELANVLRDFVEAEPRPTRSRPRGLPLVIGGTALALIAILALAVPWGSLLRSPDTTSPDTTSPDTTSPDTTSPDTTSPDTTSPDTTSPDTTPPDTTSPTQPAMLLVQVVPAGLRSEITASPLDQGTERLTAQPQTSLRLPPGAWRLRADAPGYLPTIQEVSLESAEERTVVLRLTRRELWSARLPEPAERPLVLAPEDALPMLVVPHGERLTSFGSAGEAVWFVKPGARTGPLVAAEVLPGEHAVLVTSGRALHALAGLGQVLWSYRSAAEIGAVVAADLNADGIDEVLVPAADGTLTGLSANDGERQWAARTGDRLARVSVHRSGGRTLVLALGGDGQLTCLSGAGRPMWALPSQGPAGPPLVEVLGADSPRVLLPLDEGRVLCASLEGEVRWTFDGASPKPRVLTGDVTGDGNRDVLLCTPTGAVVLSPNGAVARRLPDLEPALVVATPGGALLVATNRSGLVATDAMGNQRWSRSLGGRPLAPPRAVDLDADGRPELLARTTAALHCLDLNGELLWREGLAPGASWQTADLDGDMAPELVLSQGAEVRVWAALRANLRWRGTMEMQANQVHAAGPHVVAWPRSGERGYGWTPAADGWAALRAPAGSQPGRQRSAWDPRAQRVLVPDGSRLLAWTPGSAELSLLTELPARLGGVVASEGLLLVGTDRGDLHGRALDDPTQERWIASLLGRISAPPLPIDLDRDGVADRFLGVTCAAQACLLNREGKVLATLGLPGPVRSPPSGLSARSQDGTLPVLVACDSGHLVRVLVRGERLEVETTHDLGHALSTEPEVIFGAGPGEALVVAGTWDGWLVATDAQLIPQWTSWMPSGMNPVGPIVAADLDQDGTVEVASSWFRAASPRSAMVRVHSLAGDEHLRVFAGRQPFWLARHKAAGLFGAGEAACAWGPWVLLRHPKPSRRLVDAFAQLAGGAWQSARVHGDRLASEQGRLIAAVARERLGDDAPLRDLRRRKQAFVDRQLLDWARQAEQLEDRVGADRLLAPLGRKLAPLPEVALEPLPTQELPRGATPFLDFRSDPAGARGWSETQSALTTYERSTAREKVGVYMRPRGRVRARFEQPAAGRLELRIRHQVLKSFVRGSRIQISVDDHVVVPSWCPPGDTYREERIPLGEVTAGAHVFELRVLPRSPTYYSILELELVPSR